MYALIDGNTFYVSCERVYRPDLRTRPVIVLSNNDGCVITRSKEAKDLGIKMGDPFHKMQQLIKRHKIEVFSSNYELYGDMSQRMMSTIASLVPNVEVYSIDECFADVAGLPHLTELGRTIRNRVMQWVGIPNCVGIAPTKTLAKFCNHLAKCHPTFKGVVNWNDWTPEIQTRALNSQPVKAIWGIGWRLGESLNAMGIMTAGDLQRAESSLIRRNFGVTVERTQRELNGIACIELDHAPQARQQIIRTRSFANGLTELVDLQAAIAHHATDAAAELRKQGSIAHGASIMFHTYASRPDLPQYYANDSAVIKAGTADTRLLNQVTQGLLKRAYRTGFKFKKCGVTLTGIEASDSPKQQDWLDPSDSEESISLMQCLDGINQRYGQGTVKLGVESLSNRWLMRREYLSPRFTTRFDELLVVD